MLLNKNAKIEAVCCKDDTRQHLESPYLDLTDKTAPQLVATNGHAMVALRIEADERDTTGYVSVDALKAVRKSGPRAELICNGTCAAPNGATFPRPDVGTFPDWRQVMPSDRDGEHSIAFDVKLLKQIVDACGGSGHVRLHFADPYAPIRVEVLHVDVQHRAALMPVAR